ncbi:hypothetical protein GCM10007301_45300 [Azorhizobium oxalatiphilum]|uniref:Glycosyltransferase subfamily 4-like N-terminal domain-containing protein n=1 Tax=Azorhizobium oxalatiphilum TaxID=980631 RepID=A0A917CA60_9HYPH|nr:glycosyltransferase [Azorhizobium oxalatiphilum]GGF80077.1 hypothetical protein GCM10007301_45300 [Azorhizobium oxalatiphilum]
MRIAVFSTYDISPAENGGETRLVNIYSRLSRTEDIRVLSYDIRMSGGLRKTALTPSLQNIVAGISDRDRRRYQDSADSVELYTHDVMCIQTYAFTAEFLNEVDDAMSWADVVVLTHPYMADLVLPKRRRNQLVIYEAHNVDRRVKAAYFKDARDRVLGSSFVAETGRCEARLVREADLILVVSEDDLNGFINDYDADPVKLHVIPNGVTVGAFDAILKDARLAFREAAGLVDVDVGVFLGSAYGPNIEAYRLARQWLSDGGFSGDMLIIGRIAEAYNGSWPKVGFREHWLGFVTDVAKRLYVSSADFAVQIMTSGGGTNLKLFDYMASGVPIISNSFGARGVRENDWFIKVESAADMRDVLAQREWSRESAKKAADTAYHIVSRDFDWDQIVAKYRTLLG